MTLNTNKLLIIAILAALLLLPIIRLSYILHLFIMVFVYSGLVLSWHFVSGYTGYLSFGHAAYVGTASFVAGLCIVLYKLPVPLAILTGGMISGLIGFFVGYSCLRLRGYYYSIATLMLVFIGSTFFANITDILPTARTEIRFPMLPLEIGAYRMLFYYVFLAYLLVSIFLSMWLEKSKFGYGLRAIREDEDVADSLGVNTTRLKVIVSFLSAFFAGIIGATNAQYINYIDVATSFDVLLSFNVLFISYFGGIGTWIGPLLGSAILIPFNEILAVYLPPEVARLTYGILFIVIIISMPYGIYGFYKRIRAKE